MSFGPLDLIVPQLAATAARVAAGQPALLRTGALDTVTGTYWFFEPTADGRVSVSVLSTEHSPESHRTPVPYDSAPAQQLYAFVAREREAMTREGTEFAGYEPFITGRDGLVAALQREDRIGRVLLADFGRPVPSPL